MTTTPIARIVLAYSGSRETSLAIRWLVERHQAEVVTLTLDLGQGGELTDVRERALAAGAVRAHVIDAREELVRDYILPALQSGALYPEPERLAAPLAHALVAKRLVDIARMEGAAAVACGGAGAAGAPARARIAAAVAALDPALTVILPALDPEPPASAAAVPDTNIWGRSLEGGAAEQDGEMPDALFTLTRPAADCPDEPADVEIDFEAGAPVRANGIEMPLIELLESLDIIAGAHGVGRMTLAVSRDGTTARVVHEAPAAVLLCAAHRALRSVLVPPDLDRLGQPLARAYADLALEGRWFSPEREAIDGFAVAVRRRLTGSVRLNLLKGQCRVVEARSPLVPGAPAAQQIGDRLDRVAAEGRVS